MATETSPKTKAKGAAATNGAATKYKVIGTRPVRHDGVDKVTGRAIYGADINMAGLVHGRILRSPHAHAKIKSIDASAALKLPGVLAVVTGHDFPEPEDKMADLGEGTVNLAHLSSNCLAHDKALYRGHAVAAVAATTPHVAEEALKLIQVEYEPLPAVTWVLDAMQDDAPLLHDNVFTDSMGKIGTKPTNVSKHLHFEKGDVDKGFAEADLVDRARVQNRHRASGLHRAARLDRAVE